MRLLFGKKHLDFGFILGGKNRVGERCFVGKNFSQEKKNRGGERLC